MEAKARARPGQSESRHEKRARRQRAAVRAVRKSRVAQASRARDRRFRRARLRQFLLTVGPDRLSGGRLSRRHMSRPIVTRRLEISTPAWPRELDGLRIGHVSDFHVGGLLPVRQAIRIINLLAAEKPDLIACTGDVMDLHHQGAEDVFLAMAAVGAPLGTAFVLGNHDELHCARTISRQATRAGVTLLRNRTMTLAVGGKSLRIAGVDFANSAVACARNVDKALKNSDHPRAAARPASPGPDDARGPVHLLLAHNPRAFPRAVDKGVPLTLSGHTHGGQIALRNRPRANLALGHKYRVGLFENGDSRLYVTAGVGAWFPLRVNCPAEFAVITMRSG